MARKQRKVDSGLRWGEGSVSKRECNDGTVSYQARWPEGEGKAKRWRAKTFPTEEQAEDHLRAIARKKRAGTFTPESTMTVEELIATFLARNKHKWITSTYLEYVSRADLHINPVLGNVRVVDLTRARVQAWLDDLSGSASLLNQCRVVLRGAIKYAIRMDIIDRNPTQDLEMPETTTPRKHATWSHDEVRAVFDEVRGQPFWDALYHVALLTGMRPGEVRALRWRDVDLKAREITVHSTTTVDAQWRLIVDDRTKTGRARVVSIPTSCVDLLKEWRKSQVQRQLEASSWRDEDFVFADVDGRILDDRRWQRYQDKLSEKLGITRLTLHELRHTNASLEAAAGTHPTIVAHRLGHVDPAMTLRVYSHPTPDVHREASEELDRRLSEDRKQA